MKVCFFSTILLLSSIAAKGQNCGPGTYWHSISNQCLPDPLICGPGTIWDEAFSMCLPISNCVGDLNNDQVIGSTDLLVILSSFGLSCEQGIASTSCCFDVHFQQHTYETTNIAGKCWFAENLRSKFYANGDSIEYAGPSEDWTSAFESGIGAYSFFQNDSSFIVNHGLHYNGFAVIDNRGLCPTGWHVPDNEDFTNLLLNTGTETVGIHFNEGSGLSLKQTAEESPGWHGSNLYGWSATQSGFRTQYNWTLSWSSWYWSTNEQPNGDLHNWRLSDLPIDMNSVFHGMDPKYVGGSIRCVQD